MRAFLAALAECGFDAAPRYFGRDEQGRETFSYLEGDVPNELDAGFSDEAVSAAARLNPPLPRRDRGLAVGQGRRGGLP